MLKYTYIFANLYGNFIFLHHKALIYPLIFQFQLNTQWLVYTPYRELCGSLLCSIPLGDKLYGLILERNTQPYKWL